MECWPTRWHGTAIEPCRRASRSRQPQFPRNLRVLRRRRAGGDVDAEGRCADRASAGYFWARLAYLPLYAAGIAYLRSLVWAVSLLGMLMVLAGLF
jgi:uncharacterized MAPEG superfamily protein